MFRFEPVALRATLHCLTGCAIGEVLGLVLSTALGWHDLPSIVLATVLAFIFGYSFTFVPLMASGMSFPAAARVADLLFWGSLVVGLILAFFAAYPVNAWMIRRGMGHARGHAHHPDVPVKAPHRN